MTELRYAGSVYNISREQAEAVKSGIVEATSQHTGFSFTVTNSLGEVWLHWTPGVAVILSEAPEGREG